MMIDCQFQYYRCRMGTPLGEQLDDAGRYFRGAIGATAKPTRARYSSAASQISFSYLGWFESNWFSFSDQQQATDRNTQDHSTTFTGTHITHGASIAVGFSLSPPTSFADRREKWRRQLLHGQQWETSWKLPCENAISQILAASFSFATPVIPTTGTSRQHERLSGVIPIQSNAAFLARIP